MKKVMIYKVYNEGGGSSTSPKCQCRIPQPSAPSKDQQLESFPPQKQHWESSGDNLRNFRLKNLRITEQEGKANSFIPSPSQHCSEPRGNFPSRENFPHREKKSWVSNHLPQPFRAPHEGPILLSPNPDWQS